MELKNLNAAHKLYLEIQELSDVLFYLKQSEVQALQILTTSGTIHTIDISDEHKISKSITSYLECKQKRLENKLESLL